MRGINWTIGVVAGGVVTLLVWAVLFRGGPPVITVGNATGKPGDTVAVEAKLENGAGKIVAVSSDIIYDSTQVNVVRKADGSPDCAIGAAIGGGTAADKSLLSAIRDVDAVQKQLRFGVINLQNQNPIPDGVLLTCRFVIAATATAGATTLRNSPEAANVGADEVAATGTDGTITVE